MIEALGIALTGLDAATKKLNATANNIANLQTVGSLQEGAQAPYVPQTTQQQTSVNGGVQTSIVDRSNPFASAYSPDSPFADENGIIGIPNIDLAEEGVNLLLSKITYKANAAIIETSAELSDELLKTLDEEA